MLDKSVVAGIVLQPSMLLNRGNHNYESKKEVEDLD
jgi:hypothetical protein